MKKINYEKFKNENEKKLRKKLFEKSLASTLASKNSSFLYNRQTNVLQNRAQKTTDMLNSLVLRMSEQVLNYIILLKILKKGCQT